MPALYSAILACYAQQAMPESKYPLTAPPPDLLTEIGTMVSSSQPPRYEGQLRRGYAFDESEGPKTDDMIEQMEAGLGEQHAQDEQVQEQAEQQPKPKAKAKAKTKGKAKAKACVAAPANEPEIHEPPRKKARAADGDPCDFIPLYPKDPLEPPPHVMGNHIYSNCYKKLLAGGMSKEEARDEARYQCLLFRSHGVVSRAKVGTFRAPKKNKNLNNTAE